VGENSEDAGDASVADNLLDVVLEGESEVETGDSLASFADL
jgi:hypothetical protein